ncbi:MAG: GGDEF domain-containing protein [Defluviitaleaceae bacterium]|nr:GGDEF domain-containing protein [Defluviitaleaceae bacterium]
MERERMYLEIINVLKDGVYFVDTERRITFWNKAAEKISGYAAHEIVGLRCQESKLSHINAEGCLLCEIGCPLYATIIDGTQRSGNVFLRHKNGHRVPVRVNMFPITENGEIVGGVEVFSQSSPVVYDNELIDSLQNQATIDTLTGLPNRRSLETFLEYKFSEVSSFDKTFCVLFIDIDDFGNFNKTYGHEIGDAVLKSMSSSIMHTIRNTDIFGRWGGEEFAGVFEIKQEYEASIVAEKIRVLISKSEVEISPTESVTISASVGATIIRKDDTLVTVMKRADELMRKAKEGGKNRVSFSA